MAVITAVKALPNLLRLTVANSFSANETVIIDDLVSFLPARPGGLRTLLAASYPSAAAAQAALMFNEAIRATVTPMSPTTTSTGLDVVLGFTDPTKAALQVRIAATSTTNGLVFVSLEFIHSLVRAS